MQSLRDSQTNFASWFMCSRSSVRTQPSQQGKMRDHEKKGPAPFSGNAQLNALGLFLERLGVHWAFRSSQHRQNKDQETQSSQPLTKT